MALLDVSGGTKSFSNNPPMSKNPNFNETTDDIVSLYGSVSGGTFVSRRSRRDGSTWNATKVDKLAKALKEFEFGQEAGGERDAKLAAKGPESSTRRFNTSFHHFRFLVVMLAGVSVGLMMLMRFSMTISILNMVNQTHLYLSEHPNKTLDDFLSTGHSQGGEFNWNNEIVAIILSWYMFSYTLPQVPTARLAAKVGCRLSMSISLAICAISSILTPMSAYMGWKYVVAVRLLNGLGASAVQPMLLHTVETWMRYDEISLGLSISQTLNTIFITLTPLIAGYLAAIHWSYSFHVPGIFTLIFCVLWYVLIADEPEQSYWLSEKELDHIMDSERVDDSDQHDHRHDNRLSSSSLKRKQTQLAGGHEPDQVYKPDSWLQILKVPSFYAHIVMWCLCSSSYSGFIFVFPTYMQQFLRINVAQTGLICFVIQLGSIISVLWPHPLVRWLQGRGLSVTSSRIIGQSICCFMVASTWMYVGLFHDNQSLVLFLNRCFQGGSDVIVVGALMSNYAKAGLSSLAFSIVNTIGHLSIVGASTLIGWLLDHTGQSRTGWSWIYMGLGMSEVFMWITFTFFIDSEPIKFKSKRVKFDIGSQEEACESSEKSKH